MIFERFKSLSKPRFH